MQKPYAGVVREISAFADSATRTFNVRVSIKNTDEAVRFGMTAGVSFQALSGQKNATLLIPSSALTAINGQKIVWVIDANNKAQPREVVAGVFREDGVLITSGLQAGEKIAIAGVHTLIKNQLVHPVTEAKPVAENKL
jgi:RND family efflux transporter MFP subunit